LLGLQVVASEGAVKVVGPLGDVIAVKAEKFDEVRANLGSIFHGQPGDFVCTSEGDCATLRT